MLNEYTKYNFYNKKILTLYTAFAHYSNVRNWNTDNIA